MSLVFVTGDALSARLDEVRRLFANLTLEEVEHRRACVLQVKRRLSGQLSLGAYQYLNLCIEHAESLIIASAVTGDILSDESVDAITARATADFGSALNATHSLLGSSNDPGVNALLDEATIRYASTDC